MRDFIEEYNNLPDDVRYIASVVMAKTQINQIESDMLKLKCGYDHARKLMRMQLENCKKGLAQKESE